MTGIIESKSESYSEEEGVTIKIENSLHCEQGFNKEQGTVFIFTTEGNVIPKEKVQNPEDVLVITPTEINDITTDSISNSATRNGTVRRKMSALPPLNTKRRKTSEIDTVDSEETRCRVCDKEFYDVDSLANHRDYHLSHRTCCLCQKVMGNKSKLLTHHRSHTKELPYSCQVCEKRFAENSTLRKHAATHGERNFRCNVCSKAFVRKDYLAKHLLTHQQTYKCSQCGFVCHNRTDIEVHIGEMHRG